MLIYDTWENIHKDQRPDNHISFRFGEIGWFGVDACEVKHVWHRI